MFYKIIFAGLAGFFLSSCSLLLPYEEEPLCKLGKEGGYCGSISDVYEHTLNIKPEHRTPVKLKPGVPCHNCDVKEYEHIIEQRKGRKDFIENYSQNYLWR